MQRFPENPAAVKPREELLFQLSPEANTELDVIYITEKR